LILWHNIVYDIFSRFSAKSIYHEKKHNWTFEETSNHFEMPMRKLFRWSNRIEPITKHASHKTKIDKAKLIEDVELYSDSYIYERAERLGAEDGNRGCGDIMPEPAAPGLPIGKS
jgi:Transposase